MKPTLCSEELPGYIEILASNYNNLLAIEELLGDYTRQAAKQMTFAVNDDLRRMSERARGGISQLSVGRDTYHRLESGHDGVRSNERATVDGTIR